jgi:phospholipase/carboxylesterase
MLPAVALDDLEYLSRPAAGEPEGTLVLAHGRGVDETDLFPLADLLDPDHRLTVFAPGGPHRLPGQPGKHWYVVERVGFPHRESFAATYEALGRWLADVTEETGVPPERTVLGGFSQGGVMSLALGLGTGRPLPAAIIDLSGFVPNVEGWEPDLAPRAELPVYVSHGAADPIIPVEFGRAARELLEGKVALTYREHPGGHTIDPRAFEELRSFVATAFASEAR